MQFDNMGHFSSPFLLCSLTVSIFLLISLARSREHPTQGRLVFRLLSLSLDDLHPSQLANVIILQVMNVSLNNPEHLLGYRGSGRVGEEQLQESLSASWCKH